MAQGRTISLYQLIFDGKGCDGQWAIAASGNQLFLLAEKTREGIIGEYFCNTGKPLFDKLVLPGHHHVIQGIVISQRIPVQKECRQHDYEMGQIPLAGFIHSLNIDTD